MKKIYILFLLLLGFGANTQAQLIINEVLYDPSNIALEGDANNDSVYSQTQDEFIEFVNIGSNPLNVSGYQIIDDTNTKAVVYTIPNGTIIPAGGALVVFGGGNPRGLFGGAIVLADTGDGLSLANSLEVIGIKDALGNMILVYNTDVLSNNPNESYTRNPDLTGSFVQHAGINNKKFSPGTKVNGSPFITGVPKTVLLKVDMNRYQGLFDSIYVKGNFNGDCATCNPLTDGNGDKVYEVSFSTLVDTLNYVFVSTSGGIYTEENLSQLPCAVSINGKSLRTAIILNDTIIRAVCFASCSACPSNLSLKGVLDLITPLGGVSGKGIHFVADSSIANLNVYGFGVANNGGGTDGQEFRFPPIAASAGANILVVRDSSAMKAYLSSCYQQFNVVFVDTQSVVNQNGDDAIELFMAGDIIETYGNSNEDGTGKPWEYTGSWAFKNAAGLWINGAINCTDSTETIYDADCVYPICEMVKVTEITVNSASATITQNGGTLQMSVTVLPANAPDKSVTWSVDSPSIANISNTGLLTALANGKVIVKATANDGSGVFGLKEITISGQSNALVERAALVQLVYPNPVNDNLTILLQDKQSIIRIYTLEGKLQDTYEGGQMIIPMQHLSNGVYFLEVETQLGSQRIKIIKN